MMKAIVKFDKIPSDGLRVHVILQEHPQSTEDVAGIDHLLRCTILGKKHKAVISSIEGTTTSFMVDIDGI